MKPFIIVLFVGFAATALFFAVNLAEGPQAEVAKSPPASAKAETADPGPGPSPSKRSPKPAIQGDEPRAVLPPDEQAAALAQGELISSLFDAAADGSKDRIESVYAALNHPEREVREAAVDVVIQHIGRDGIPRLRAAQASAPTKDDKKQIEEAIEFLELPTLEEATQGTPPATNERPSAAPARVSPPVGKSGNNRPAQP